MWVVPPSATARVCLVLGVCLGEYTRVLIPPAFPRLLFPRLLSLTSCKRCLAASKPFEDRFVFSHSLHTTTTLFIPTHALLAAQTNFTSVLRHP